MREQKKKTPSKNAVAAQSRRRAIVTGLIQQKSAPQIAEELGISRQAVHLHLQQPETKSLIRDMMARHRERLERVVDQSIGAVERSLVSDQEQREERIRWLKDRIARLRWVIEERAEEAETNGHYTDVPGMRSGTMIHKLKSVGGGDSALVVDEYEVDTGLLKELREHEEQLRRELNDFAVNLKAVERAKDLLELAEGRHTDGDGAGTAGTRFNGTLEEVLVSFRRITTPTTRKKAR